MVLSSSKNHRIVQELLKVHSIILKIFKKSPSIKRKGEIEFYTQSLSQVVDF